MKRLWLTITFLVTVAGGVAHASVETGSVHSTAHGTFLAFPFLALTGPFFWSRVAGSFSLKTERGRYFVIAAAGGIVILAIAILRPGAHLSPVFVGRTQILFLLAAAAACLAAVRGSGTDYQAVLRQIGSESGLSLISSPAEERDHAVLYHKRRLMDRDTRRWELDGKFPYLYGERAGGILTVRIPEGFDYDPNSPTSTRVSCYKRLDLRGFSIRDRNRAGKPRKVVPTGDPGFDALYVVEGRGEDEVREILTPDIRQTLISAGSVGFGLRVDMFGVKVYLRDRVVDPEILSMWLGIIEKMAAPRDGR